MRVKSFENSAGSIGKCAKDFENIWDIVSEVCMGGQECRIIYK